MPRIDAVFLQTLLTPLDTSRLTARWLCAAWTPALGWLFGAVLLLCGTTHLVDVVVVGWPIYPVGGGLELLTAVASWGTVRGLGPVVRAALRLRSPAQLEAEVARRTAELQAEVERHRTTLTSLHAAEVRLRAALESATFVAESGHVLASLVDLESTLTRVAALAVPRFADVCSLTLVQPDGALRRVTVQANGSEQVHSLTQYVDERFPDLTSPSARRVVQSGQLEFMPAISPELVRAAVGDPELASRIIALGLRSQVTVPLTVRGRTLGALTFVTATSGRVYTDDDVRTAEDVAARAAIAVDNAQLYEALRDADRRKDQFLALLAHELRNPLAPLTSMAEIMDGPAPAEDDRRRLAAILGRQVRHLTHLVDDLLDVARITEGKIALRLETVTLGALVDRSMEMVERQAAVAGQRIEVAVALPATPVTVDSSRVVQALANLLGNAVKFGGAGGVIRVAAGVADGRAVFSVRDEGEGFEPARAERLFDMFAQEAGQQLHGGLGLGLYLVRAVAVLHGGGVRAHSAGVGQGSTFTLWLPARDAGHDADAAAAHGPAPVVARRVLVADDNHDSAETLRLLLEAEGHVVRVAHDGAEALREAQEFAPDVALLDLGMPLLDGYEVARRLTALPHRPALIVAVSGWGDVHARQRTSAAGFDAHLVKPVQWSALAAVLAR